MKNQYFTSENIKKKSGEMLEELKAMGVVRASTLIPDNSALLIIDMQEYFLEPSSHAFVPSSRAILSGVKKLISEYSERDLPVIFTRHLNTKKNAGMLGKWWSDLIEEGDPVSKISEKLEIPVCTILRKSQYDAFYNTDLEGILKGKEIKQVVICGVLTNLCCETTARSAFVRGFEVFFTIDGTATYTEYYHMAALTNLSYGFSVPVLLDELFPFLSQEKR